MATQSGLYSGNVLDLRPGLKSLVRVLVESTPVIGDVFHRYYMYSRQGIGCRGVFATHDEAKEKILESGQSDYDLCNSNRLLEAELEAHHEVKYEDYAVLFWLRGLIRPGLRIVDLGGSTGGTYYAFANALKLSDDVEWLVSELPAAVDLGIQVAKARQRPQLKFTTELGPQHRPDVLLTIGAIQYMRVRLPEILSRLGALPQHLIVHKVPVTEGQAFWTIQGLGVTEVPYYIHSRPELVSSIEALGYRLVDTCDTMRGIRIPFRPSHDVKHYSGFFFERVA